MLAKRGVWQSGSLCSLLAVAVVLGPGSVALAQTVNGAIHGTVTDATGAAIPDVSVQVINLVHGLIRTAVSNCLGLLHDHRIASRSVLDQGVENFLCDRRARSHRTSREPEFGSRLHAETRCSKRKRRGWRGSPSSETANATLGQVIDSTQVVDLPLNGAPVHPACLADSRSRS